MSVYRYKISHLQLRLGKKSPQPKIGRSRSLTSPGLTHATIIFISIDIVIVYQSCFVSDCRDVLFASVFVPSIVTVFYKSDARSCTSLSILYAAFASLKYLYRLLSNWAFLMGYSSCLRISRLASEPHATSYSSVLLCFIQQHTLLFDHFHHSFPWEILVHVYEL